MSNEINLSTSVKYHQFLNIDDTVEFLKKECNLTKDDDYEHDEDNNILNFFNNDEGDYELKLEEYIFYINSSLNYFFESFHNKFYAVEKKEALKIIPKLQELAKWEEKTILSNNCPLSISGNICKALEGRRI